MARADGNCRRCDYGMFPDFHAKGLFPYGIDCRFQEWAKLKASFNGQLFPTKNVRFYDKIDRFFTAVARMLSAFSWPLPRHRKPNRLYGFLRRKFLARKKGLIGCRPDAFVLECYSYERESFSWFLQVDDQGNPIFRHCFEINPGWNRYVLPFHEIISSNQYSNILFSLTSNLQKSFRLLITWADIVTFHGAWSQEQLLECKQTPALSHTTSTNQTPAQKVKCIAWDLDNTLWKGVLIEDGPDNVILNEKVVQVIKELDHRGVIHTILSKNDYSQAWPIIQSFGLEDYFIYPSINWNPKSGNLTQVAKEINLGLDTFAVIDDSAFERAEISEHLPMVRVFDETIIPELTSFSELDLPVTEASKNRRLSYLAEMKREKKRSEHVGDNLTFLRSCQMVMEISSPKTEPEISRCLELIQRSNQLNLSTHRYTADEFNDMLASKDHLCYMLRCKDRFGDYGIVGFVAIDKTEIPTISEIVISCRIAKKRCEHAFLKWIATKMKDAGASQINAKLIRTDRNGPLASVFQETPFVVVAEENDRIEYQLDLNVTWDDQVVQVMFGE